jgi:hypothetical protein
LDAGKIHVIVPPSCFRRYDISNRRQVPVRKPFRGQICRFKASEEGYWQDFNNTVVLGGAVSDFKKAIRSFLFDFLHKKTAINCENHQGKFKR